MKNFEVDFSKDKKYVGSEKGVCPYCGGESLNYGLLELDDESLYFPATCRDCGNEFNEWYVSTFSGQWGHPLKRKTKN